MSASHDANVDLQARVRLAAATSRTRGCSCSSCTLAAAAHPDNRERFLAWLIAEGILPPLAGERT